ncbi:calcyclin-binding protein-like [Impatiens glandulifera]|uniref:calcyclin-binding protein-like n=1 Tax=Impatiens glandulifera TaxID=253017 RepID=UPI001FB13486|nr:calcyclin-binding protein-like [Impatiens glandulifera]
MADDLQLDLQELRTLLSIAKRPRVASLISSEIRNLEEKSKEENASSVETQVPVPASTPIPTPIPISSVKAVSVPALKYVSIDTFSWDQDSDKVKIYVSLEGVDQEKVEKVFNTMSIDIKLHDVKGKDYRCVILKLNKEIVPEKCKLIVKPNRIVISLWKASKGNWLDLHFKEDKLTPNLDKNRDPMAGIMDMMKNMYEGGDEEMKRTIAKAWTDARSGKTADPLKGYGKF